MVTCQRALGSSGESYISDPPETLFRRPGLEAFCSAFLNGTLEAPD